MYPCHGGHMKEQKHNLWYVSQPSRLGGVGREAYREEVLQELMSAGYAVVHPFNAFPYAHFEGNPAVGRDQAMSYCCSLVRMCQGRVLVTGVSEGVLLEVEYALQTQTDARIEIFPQYDPEWQERLLQFYGDERYAHALVRLNRAAET